MDEAGACYEVAAAANIRAAADSMSTAKTRKCRPSLILVWTPVAWSGGMELKIETMLQQMYETELRENPPVPPWLFIPGADRYDLAWRMGAGEDQIMKIAAYFKFCGSVALARYRAEYPEPKGWEGWYDE